MTTLEEKFMAQLEHARNQDTTQSSNAMRAGKIGADLVTGGIGKALRGEVNRATRGAISNAAEKAAARYNQKEDSDNNPRAKLQGWGFWLVFGLVCLQEIANIILDISVVAAFLTPILSIFVSFIVYFYFFKEGVSLSSRRLVMWIISIIFELIPFLNIIPVFPLMLLLMRWLENNEHLKNKLSLAKKII